MQNLSMGEGAIAMHEVYLSFVNAGFSDDQAFELVKIMLRNQHGS